MKVWFWSVTTCDNELVCDFARSGDAVPYHVSDIFKSKDAAKADMLKHINGEIADLIEQYKDPAPDEVVPTLLKRFPRLAKGGYYVHEELLDEWRLQSRRLV